MFDSYTIPTAKASIVILCAPSGFVMCGYLNIDAAQKKGEAAAMVTGVATADDVLAAKIVAVTEAAEALEVRVGMTGEKAIELMQ